jgi:hypothetical protein
MASFDKVVVVSTSLVSGGPEALHQLAHALRTLGVDARMYYWPLGSQSVLTPEFSQYVVPVERSLDDLASTVVVVPETLPWAVGQFKNARVVMWWLSVDNYLYEWESRTLRRRFAESIGVRPASFNVKRPRPHVSHFAQSEYALRFLASHGLANSASMLTDYLHDEFLDADNQPKEFPDRTLRLAFNPRKGQATTTRIVASMPKEFQFVPLQGLSPAGVRATLQSCSVYIDFGQHPGRDRLPREAALCGCNVITGRLGAAANEIDIPVDAKFKLDENAPDFLKKAVATILAASTNHISVQPLFDAYRAAIRGQKKLFFEQAAGLIAMLNC